ncbi:MAG: AAA family ATPase, partial [Kineosporiaceae bacterium]
PVPPALPGRVERAPAAAGGVTWPRLPLGVAAAGTSTRETTVDLSASPLLVVAGPPGSGRTTALQALADGALAAGATVLLVHDGDVPDAWAACLGRGLRCTSAATAGSSIAAAAGSRAPCVVVVDDLDLAGPAAEQALTAAVAGPAAPAVVAAATTAWLAGSFRGLAAEARRRGDGLLLRPGRHDGRDVLGVAVPGQESRLPGRGVLVRAGMVTRVQVGRVTGGGTDVSGRAA